MPPNRPITIGVGMKHTGTTSHSPDRGQRFIDVLIVDDETAILKVLSEIITEIGHRVRVAESGASALDALAEQSSALVITDIKMPGITGFELAHRIRELYPKTHLVLMTGYSFEQSHQEADELQVSGFLKKPFKTSELAEIIDRVAQQDARAD